MKFTLNPYTLVINQKGVYNFILSDVSSSVSFAPSEEQVSIIENMHKGTFYEYEELCNAFGKEATDNLVKTGCVIPGTIDTSSMHSRTNAFFLTHNMPEARAKLSSKKILILGCGGIGTHMAWHMTALGVNSITLVDFDTVEESNLNRQLLFDRNDVGTVKTETLKKKLEAINTEININTICAKISSEEELEKICLTDKYDLIIKALDSPAQFPDWLDSVARKHNLTYIAGITMRENVLVGPTFIPGQSSYGWSELMNVKDGGAEKVYGTSPSLGILLYHISDELAIEAFKILTGYGKPKYTDKILCKNIITDEEHYFQKEASAVENTSVKTENASGRCLVMNIMLMAAMAIACTQITWFIPVALVMAMAMPFFLYKSSKDVVKCTFINATVFAVGILVRLVGSVDLSSPVSLVSSLVMLFGVHSAITLVACTVNFFLHKVVYKNKD